MPASIIAIDGPVASGKSSIGKRLADRLGYLFFDTGVMYRAVTFLALRGLGSADDAAAGTALPRPPPTATLPPTPLPGPHHPPPPPFPPRPPPPALPPTCASATASIRRWWWRRCARPRMLWSSTPPTSASTRCWIGSKI